MIDIFLNHVTANGDLKVEFTAGPYEKINIIDKVENIPGHYDEFESNGNIEKNYYNDLDITFWTLDYNAERLNGENSGFNTIFKSDPWLLFHAYNKNRNKFECNFYAEPNKKFICLMFNSQKDHRKTIFDFIISKNFDCYISRVDEGIKLTEMPEHFEHGYHKDNFNYGVPKEYFYALIDIVTESYLTFSSHFSEKSYKPLIHKKPFLTFAGPYYYDTLKKYNFELYDELFDYSFDIVKNKEQRISEILLQLLEINNHSFYDIKNVIDNLKEKIEHNYQNLFKVKSKFYSLKNET
jgi:hypothetical protein